MPTTKTGYWVRIVDEEVLQVWDYSPSEEQKQAEDGWKEAVEIFPDMIDHREILTTHTINIDATPVEIVWSKRQLNIDERKATLIAEEKTIFRKIAEEQMFLEIVNPETYGDINVITEAKAAKDQNIAEINALTTHEEVDARMGLV